MDFVNQKWLHSQDGVSPSRTAPQEAGRALSRFAFILCFIFYNTRYLTDSVLKLQSVSVFLNMFKLQSKGLKLFVQDQNFAEYQIIDN